MGSSSSGYTTVEFVVCSSCKGSIRATLLRCPYCGQRTTGREKAWVPESRSKVQESSTVVRFKRKGLQKTDKLILFLTAALVLLVAIRLFSWLA